MATMIAARLHAYGSPMTLDRIEVPEPRPTDVLVEVKACGVVPNLARVVSNFFGSLTPDNKMMPPLPAIFGLDPTGVVAKVGAQVFSIRPGRPRLCQSGAVLRLMQDVPQRQGAGLSEFHLAGLFRPLAGYHARLSVWRAGAVHHRARHRAGQIARQSQLRSRRAARLFRHRLFGDEEDRRRPRPDALDQRHQRAARAQRRAACAGDGRDKNPRHRPQAGAARSREGIGAATHRCSCRCRMRRRKAWVRQIPIRSSCGPGRRPKAMASTA